MFTWTHFIRTRGLYYASSFSGPRLTSHPQPNFPSQLLLPFTMSQTLRQYLGNPPNGFLPTPTEQYMMTLPNPLDLSSSSVTLTRGRDTDVIHRQSIGRPRFLIARHLSRNTWKVRETSTFTTPTFFQGLSTWWLTPLNPTRATYFELTRRHACAAASLYTLAPSHVARSDPPFRPPPHNVGCIIPVKYWEWDTWITEQDFKE